VTSQEVTDLPASVAPKDLQEAVHLVDSDGSVYRGAEAVFRTLAHAPRGGLPLWLYRHVPGFASVAEAVYARVARNRGIA
jgi:predicted DCC family thiol-disulfide oxidoreductase YuxK